jgi:raffinose/stachyose/melibiose transport system permease protein
MSHTQAPRRRRRILHVGFLAALPFLAPVLLMYGMFVISPMISSIVLSFFDWSGYEGAPRTFVGLDNYIRVFTADPVFWQAFFNTVQWVLLSMIIPVALGLAMALALNRPIFGRNVFRSVFYIPGVVAAIAVANMWRWIYNPNLGVGASLGKALGLPWLADIQWLGNPNLALYSVFVAFVWQIAGTNMVLFIAGLQGVSQEQTEAARVDGANARQVFWNVTLPALRPALVIVIVTTVIHSIKLFDLIVGMTGGGPAQRTQVLALWSYTQSFLNSDYGVGNAIATILLFVTLIVVVPYILWTARSTKEN